MPNYWFITPLDNLDGTFDHDTPVASQTSGLEEAAGTDAAATLGSFVRNLTDGPYYAFTDLPKAVKLEPGTKWASAAQISADPAQNTDAIKALLKAPPPVAPTVGAVVWVATNPSI